ncbi:unnamed protein product [Auanema sp. JU1783]|nr:unnamed protein product [Auanema sp. JU1783]
MATSSSAVSRCLANLSTSVSAAAALSTDTLAAFAQQPSPLAAGNPVNTSHQQFMQERLRHLRGHRSSPISLPSGRIVRSSKRSAISTSTTSGTNSNFEDDDSLFELRRQIPTEHQFHFVLALAHLQQLCSVSPIGDSCTAASSTNLMPAPRHDRRYDAQRVSQARCTRSLSPAHPHRANNGLDDMQRPYKFDLILRTPPPDASTQESHAWNPEDRSMNIFVKDDDKFTFHRHPVAQSTDCIRGKTGYSRGFHVWQLEWPGRQRGTHAVVGVGTKGASLHAVGYTSLIGTDEESYGWDLTRGECYHDSKHCAPWTYPMDVNGRSGDDYSVPDKFFCILDMDEGFLAFATEKDYLGVAFRNLKGKTVYPIVSAVWGHCEITMKYLGGLEPQPRDLLEICRNKIRRELGVTRLARVDELQIPPRLKQYVVFG